MPSSGETSKSARYASKFFLTNLSIMKFNPLGPLKEIDPNPLKDWIFFSLSRISFGKS